MSRQASPFLSLPLPSTCARIQPVNSRDYLFPSPRARDTVSFGLDDILQTAASDSEDFGPALADALPPSGQEAQPSPAYSELMDVLSRATEKLALDLPDEPRESRASKLDERFLVSRQSLSSPLVPVQVPVLEGSSRSRNTEPCGRFSVEAETQAGGMDVEPSDSVPDLGSVWQSGSGPLCFSRVIPVSALVLPEFPDDSGHRCVRPPVAECHAVRVSANKADPGSTMQSKGEQCPSPSHSPILALSDLVLGVNSPLVSVPL